MDKTGWEASAGDCDGGCDDLLFTIEKVSGELHCGGLHVLDVVASKCNERERESCLDGSGFSCRCLARSAVT